MSEKNGITEFRKDRPKSVVGPENINAVQKLIMQDRYVTYCEIEATLETSSTSIQYIKYCMNIWP